MRERKRDNLKDHYYGLTPVWSNQRDDKCSVLNTSYTTCVTVCSDLSMLMVGPKLESLKSESCLWIVVPLCTFSLMSVVHIRKFSCGYLWVNTSN